jgi:hypothetical protein
MAERLGTYYPDQVALIACGILVSGYASGTFITVERTEDSFKLQKGADGEGVRTRTNNRSGTITFTLLQSSLTNILLSALMTLDETSAGGDGILPSLLKDNSGTTLAKAEESWLTKPSNIEYADDGTNREWVITCNALDTVVGGN